MARYREAVGIGGSGAVYEYTSSLSHDPEIFPYIVRVLVAHTLHLHRRGLIPGGAACKALAALLEALDAGAGAVLGEGYEDAFEALEDWLEERTRGASAYIWLGRSRNDHVSAALRLYAMDRVAEALHWLAEARGAVLRLAGRYRGVPVLLHTHAQPSQLATLDCLLLAWEEALASAWRLLHSTLTLLDRSPLGAGAGAGTVAPLDPGELAGLAGFSAVLGSSVYAAGSRLDLTAAALAAAAVLVEASRIAGDLMLLSSPYVAAARIPDSHVATSSIMPHKRNPATLEVLRARAARAAGLAAGVLAVQKGLPYGYNLDLQEANPLLYTLLRDAAESARILADLLSELEFDRGRLERLALEYPAWSAEAAELLALREGIPLREAYKRVAAEVRAGRLEGLLEKLGASSPLDLVSRRATGCTPGLDYNGARGRLEADRAAAETLRARLREAERRLLEAARGAAGPCMEG
ncbi:lyase family protein [Stetteria hydrogenophila]